MELVEKVINGVVLGLAVLGVMAAAAVLGMWLMHGLLDRKESRPDVIRGGDRQTAQWSGGG